ncbi:hypothetical protein [Nocardia sp. NPDC050793]|uniref:hypothetical protein n=1 Tax=Nocardia sp. NPDC050793 TaxID=3155159 RepID=UPI0033C43424
MSAHSYLVIERASRRWRYCPIPGLTCREGFLSDIAALFREDEQQCDQDRFRYVTTVRALRDRLQLHGFTSEGVSSDLRQAVDEENLAVGPTMFGEPAYDAGEILARLRNYLNWRDSAPDSDDRPGVEDVPCEYDPPELVHRLPSRTLLRLVVDLVDDPTTSVHYHLDDLPRWRLLQRGTPVADEAREARRRSIATDAPLVILTEGSTDSQLLSAAIEVTHPHLAQFLRFMDFSSGAAGSADNLAKLVRSFIGAGVANRVLALADNDTAGRDALAKLTKEGVPDNYRLRHYPPIPLLASYPTLGPQLPAPVLMDVNGSAGSLEMYLGKELLTVDGRLIPVQWTGYVEGQRAYQGAIAARDKKRIQDDFRAKVKQALADPSRMANQDWSGIEAIVDTIMTAFA